MPACSGETATETSFLKLILGEDEIFEEALDVASLTGASGFDTSFIALAKLMGGLLITDDVKMAKHAESIGVTPLLLRETTEEHLRDVLSPP